MAMKTLPWGKKIGDRFAQVMQEGLTPEKLAMTVAVGVTLGIVPVVWGTGLLCAVVAYFLRLNQPLVQVVHLTTYPLQILLFLPFFRLGQELLPAVGGDAAVEMSFSGMLANPGLALRLAWLANLKAVAVWALAAPVSLALLYFLFRWLFRIRVGNGRNIAAGR
jgi:uncharacterized protein (DUF2062 family)